MSPPPSTWPQRAPGLALAITIGLTALLAEPVTKRYGMSALPLAIVIGIMLGNTVFPALAARAGAGVDFARTRLLRIGIVLFGFRLTFQEILGIGAAGIITDILIVTSVFALAMWLGTRVLKLDRDTSALIGSGAAICGAAAVMAAEPVVKAPPHKVSVAVATVVLFGTIAMFLYPFLYPMLSAQLGLDAHSYGVYVGSTVHEVAQVVVAGEAVSKEAANTAVTTKMIRVILLAPFLLLLSAWLRERNSEGAKSPLVIPWFAVLFLVVGAFNSLQLLPKEWVGWILKFDAFLLATAMGALGLRTNLRAIAQAGARPMLLAGLLFVWLLVGGLGLNVLVARVLA